MDNKSFPPFHSQDAHSTIAIDFDGVIHNDDKGFHDGTVYGEPIEGVESALRNLASKFKIVIFTAKAKSDRPLINGKTGTELVQEWFDKHNFSQYISEITSDKPRAILYIDDNGYRFNNWGDTIRFVEANVK